MPRTKSTQTNQPARRPEKPLPPPPVPGELLYGRTWSGERVVVGAQGMVSVPIDQWAEYKARYGLTTAKIIPLPGSGTLVVVEKESAE